MTSNDYGNWGIGGLGQSSRTPFYFAERDPNSCRAYFSFDWKSNVDKRQQEVMTKVERIVRQHTKKASLFCGYTVLDYIGFDRTKLPDVRSDIDKLLEEFPDILDGVDISLFE